MPKNSKDKELKLNNINQVVENNSAKSQKSSKTESEKKATNKRNSSKVKNVKKRNSVSTSSSKTSKKTSIKSLASNKSTPDIVEYYDLPFRYNQTVVKILAQTPNILFIYWDISDTDKKYYLEKYGPSFFQDTRPYLIITNETMNYTFEVEINDFANSWYLHVNDSDCKYKVELSRKFIINSSYDISNKSNEKNYTSYFANDYLHITSSNKIEMPNNHILIDNIGKSVFFRNVKTNITNKKDISSISFMQKIGKVYNIYDLYKEVYKDELISDEFKLDFPSSHNSSSFK